MLTLKNITKTYQNGKVKTEVLKGISLQIKQGEFIAITGCSGCGKSTLLNIMGGMDSQTEGVYHFEDVCVHKLGDKKLAKFRNKSIGFVFQAFHLANELSAVDNVALPLGYAGVGSRERKKRAKEVLNQVGVLDKYKSRPSELSGGQKQRVAIARAIANYPKVLLADEPTGNLDRENGQMVMNLLKKLNEEGLTIIMVTHDHTLAAQTSRIIHMEDGIIY